MNNLLHYIILLYIFLAILFVFYFYLYLFSHYKKATANFYQRQVTLTQQCRTKRKVSESHQVKNNATACLDPDEVNARIGCAVIEYIDKHNVILKSLIIYNRVFEIGREPSNDLVISNQTVSRRHCKIELRSGEFIIHNLSHVKPITVNNVPVNDSKQLQFGDIIQISSFRFRFRDVAKQANAG